jgi:predicted CXXCH cytochrome family protein
MTSFARTAAPPDDWRASVHASALLTRGDTSAPTCSSCHGSHGATPPGLAAVTAVCAQCHLREAELFRQSPKREIFDALGLAECVGCHDNHRIESPTDASVGLNEGTVCARCHDDAMGGAQTIRAFRQDLDRLSTEVAAADEVLAQAERAGMLVDDGRLALRESRQQLVQARVLLHTFAAMPFNDVSAQGIAAAARARRAGENAMVELSTRRRGLAIATLIILAFLFALGLKIRRLPEPPPA